MVHADAFGYMRQMAVNEKTFGVVVLDPPKLIADRDEVPAGKRKYFDLNVLAMRLVEPGGLLLTCSCSGLLRPLIQRSGCCAEEGVKWITGAVAYYREYLRVRVICT